MNHKSRIEELKELHRLFIYDLKNTNRIEDKIGNNPHLEAMKNLYVDHLFEINREIESLQ